MPDYKSTENQFVCKGINLRDSPDLLESGQFRRLTNVVASTEGALSTRPGRVWVAGAATGEPVHTLCRLGTAIISGSGKRVYRNDTPYPTIFNGKPLHTVTFESSASGERWLYVTDGAQFRLLGEDGSDIKWGITAPVDGVTAVVGGGGVLDSDIGGFVYSYRAVYKNSRTGAKSNPSPVVAGIALISQKAKLSIKSSLDGQVDTVEFYRDGGANDLGKWRLIGSCPNGGIDPSTNLPKMVEFVDNMPDAQAIKGFVLEVDNDVPFTTTASDGGNTVKEAVFNYIWGPAFGMIFGAGDPNRPGDVYWTNPGRPHSASVFNHISVSPPDEPIIGGFVHGGVSYAWTTANLYALDYQGRTLTFMPRKTFVGRGLSAPQAFAVGPWVYFLSKDGVYLTDCQSPAEPYSEPIRPLFNPQVQDRRYVAPGMLGAVKWPSFSVSPPRESGEGIRDFSIAVSENSVSLVPGGSTSLTITVGATPQFWHTVELSIVQTLPAGITYRIEPPSGTPGESGFSATLILSASTEMPVTNFSFQVRGKRAGGSTAKLSGLVNGTVSQTPAPPPGTGEFTLAFSPSTISIPRREDGQLALRLTGTSSVTLAAQTLPNGVSLALSSVNVVGQNEVIVTLSVNELAILGNQTVEVKGTAGGVTKTAALVLKVTGIPENPPEEERRSSVRFNYGNNQLHLHYIDNLGQWVHLRNDVAYSRWFNDESPEIEGIGSVYETISYYDNSQPNVALLLGSNFGLVALETGTFDYVPNQKIQCRIRTGSDTLGAPRTLKEYGNVILEVNCGDAVLPMAIDPAQPPGIAMVAFLDAESKVLTPQRLSGEGRIKLPLDMSVGDNGNQIFAYSTAIDLEWNGNATVFGYQQQFHVDEEIVSRWVFGPTSHGLKGWQHVREIFLTLHPFQSVEAFVEIDGVSYPLVLDSGSKVIEASGKKKVHLWAPPVKGKLFKWNLRGEAFKVYTNECEVRVKEFANVGYNLINPFAGGSSEV